jgi:DNA-directed RNA polymerase sigma subunit (sigma70/sigma32)
MIRVPDSMLNRFIKAQKVLKDFYFEHGCSPSSEQITELTGLQPSDLQLMAQSYHHKSSDDPIFEGDQKVSVIDAFSELNPRAGDSFETDIEVSEQIEKIEIAMLRLDEESRCILREYFGLDGNEEKNLTQLAKERGTCRESVRLKKDKALIKLKSYINFSC